jgi:hypothetical protein
MIWILRIPQRLMCQRLSSPAWCCWEVVETLRGRAQKEVFGSMEACPEGVVESLSLPLSLSLPSHEVRGFSLPHTPYHDRLPCHRPKSDEVN